MNAEIPLHQLCLTVTPSESIEIEAGMPFTLQVAVSCAMGCDLEGATVEVACSEEFLATGDLVGDGNRGFTTTFALRAPAHAGEQSWAIRVPKIAGAHAVHSESALVFNVRTCAHMTSLAIWDVTSPVSILGPLKLRIGAKCAATCALTGQRVDIFDDQGTPLCEVRLCEAPLDGTSALYWADVVMRAPATEGVRMWSAALNIDDLQLPHHVTRATFSFRTDMPPKNHVVIQLLEKGTHSPLEAAEVGLGLYRRVSGPTGLAAFELPDGIYDVTIRKDGYELPPMTIKVADEMTVRIEALKTWTQAEREERLARCVDVEWG